MFCTLEGHLFDLGAPSSQCPRKADFFSTLPFLSFVLFSHAVPRAVCIFASLLLLLLILFEAPELFSTQIGCHCHLPSDSPIHRYFRWNNKPPRRCWSRSSSILSQFLKGFSGIAQPALNRFRIGIGDIGDFLVTEAFFFISSLTSSFFLASLFSATSSVLTMLMTVVEFLLVTVSPRGSLLTFFRTGLLAGGGGGG